MSVERIASRYAKSLVELASEQNKLEEVHEDILTFRNALESRDLYLMLKSPIIHANKKRDIFKQIFEGKISDLTLSFMDIVAAKGRESYLPEIAVAFVDQYKEIKHITTVYVTSAIPLTEEARDDIKAKLKASGEVEENIELITKVDESIIGGIIIEFGGKRYDASVAHQLDTLKADFANN